MADRAHFKSMYNDNMERARNQAALPERLSKIITQIGNGAKMIEDRKN